MALKKENFISIARGDRLLKDEWKDGELFYQYQNLTDPNHPISEGQLFIYIKSKLIELVNRRSIDSFVYKGFLSTLTSLVNNDIHKGDIYVSDQTGFNSVLNTYVYKDDIVYISSEDKDFIIIQSPKKYIYSDSSSLGNNLLIDDAIKELENKMSFKGVINSFDGIISTNFGDVYYLSNDCNYNNTQYYKGSFIIYGADDYIVLRANTSEDIKYFSKTENITNHKTFSESHKSILNSFTNVSKAIDNLSLYKAELDLNGKININQLPTEVVGGLKYKGFWDPFKTYLETHSAESTPKEELEKKENQDYWPDANPFSGNYYIVKTSSLFENFKYYDKDSESERFLILNNNDYVIWTQTDDGLYAKWEKIDNKNSIKFIKYDVENDAGQIETVVVDGTPYFATEGGSLKLKIENGKTIISGENLISLDDLGDYQEYSIPFFKRRGVLATSALYQDTHINSKLGIDIEGGELNLFAKQFPFSNPINPKFSIQNLFDLNKNNNFIERVTTLSPSLRTNFFNSPQVLDIYFPEKSSTLIGIEENKHLSSNYLPVTSFDGFLEDSSIYEAEHLFYDSTYNSVVLKNRSLVSKIVNTNNIIFSYFSDTQDLPIDEKVKIQFKIDPILETISSKVDNVVYIPSLYEESHIATLEDINKIYNNGINKIYNIPRTFLNKDIYGNDSFQLIESSLYSRKPNITLKVSDGLGNEYDLEELFSLLELSSYSKSDKSFIQNSNREKDEDDSAIINDGAIESRRYIASKEAFILPSARYTDNDVEITEDDRENHFYSTIVPSQTKFKSDIQYYDKSTDSIINQDLEKVFELPSKSGILLSSNSIIECGVIIDEKDFDKLFMEENRRSSLLWQ